MPSDDIQAAIERVRAIMRGDESGIIHSGRLPFEDLRLILDFAARHAEPDPAQSSEYRRGWRAALDAAPAPAELVSDADELPAASLLRDAADRALCAIDNILSSHEGQSEHAELVAAYQHLEAALNLVDGTPAPSAAPMQQDQPDALVEVVRVALEDRLGQQMRLDDVITARIAVDALRQSGALAGLGQVVVARDDVRTAITLAYGSSPSSGSWQAINRLTTAIKAAAQSEEVSGE